MWIAVLFSYRLGHRECSGGGDPLWAHDYTKHGALLRSHFCCLCVPIALGFVPPTLFCTCFFPSSGQSDITSLCLWQISLHFKTAGTYAGHRSDVTSNQPLEDVWGKGGENQSNTDTQMTKMSVQKSPWSPHLILIFHLPATVNKGSFKRTRRTCVQGLKHSPPPCAPLLLSNL